MRDFARASSVALGLVFVQTLAGQASGDAARVQEIFSTQCAGCHGPAKLSGLDLRDRESILKGGTRGPAIKPGDAAHSVLYQAVAHSSSLTMPPGKPPLPAADIETIRRWIDAGAAWNRTTADAEPSWWSFRKPKRPTVPQVQSPAWVRNPIDAFLLAKMEKEKLKPAEPASKRILARRLYFDLLGLPPTPEQMEAFLRDESPQAYEKLVDQLLGSPHYGERWGRYWLDVARYADTGGYQTDLYYKDAWRYRDYIIHAFNTDKPYDRFVQEQIAADELWPDNLDLNGSYYIDKTKMQHIEARLGTGLYTISPVYHESGLDAANYFDMQWTDWVDTTGSAFLGLTVGCARCHDHKFDAISQRDYYGLRAIFAGSDRLEIPLVHRMDLFDQWQFYPKQVRMQQLRWEIEKINQRAREAILGDMRSKFEPAAWEAYQIPEERRTMEQRTLAAKVETAITAIKAKEIDERLSPAERDLRAQFTNAIGKTFLETLKPASTATVLGHTEVVPNIYLLIRGDYRKKGPKVEPALPLSLCPEGNAISAAEGSVLRRRKALAEWLTRPDHPLTARVMVNRIWQGHFGRGIVGTPNDFGRQGELPTHPELLDWLATEFVQHGWSVKHIHRLILLSNAYRMSSAFDAAKAAIDPRNLLLWRMNPRRLQAEEIWDSVHAVAGTLMLTANPMRFLRKSAQPDPGLLNPMGGPPAFPPLSADEMEGGDLLDKSQWPVSPDPQDHNRRAVYICVKRSFQYPILNAFDAPDAALSCGRRQSTTVAPQSLALMNSRIMQRQAEAFATLLLRQSGNDAAALVGLAWRRAVSRAPDAGELHSSLALLQSLETSGPEDRPAWLPAEMAGVSSRRAEAVAKFCLAMLNLNEFLYVD
jgi:mono/diheme cytochrome c family protein